MSSPGFIGHVDKFTGAQLACETDHAYIHDGIGFTAIFDGTINSGATNILELVTPAATIGYIHLRPALIYGVASSVSAAIYETQTATSGSAITPTNRNRNSTRAAGMTVKSGVTSTPSGTAIDWIGVGTGGTPARTSGGGGGSVEELVLKPATKYTVVLTNTGGSNSQVICKLFWYEEPMGA